jgi:hypothetical protein
MKRWISWILVAVALMCAMYAGIYISALRSEAFKFSEQWIRESHEVQKAFGTVTDVKLDFLGGFTEEAKGDYREARVSTVTTGSRGQGPVELELQRRNGIWGVVDFHIAQDDSR